MAYKKITPYHGGANNSNLTKVGIANDDPEHNFHVTGDLAADQLIINKFNTTTTDSVRELFVYDTRKDSDGGAWRKRTQHTSWYNEVLQTSQRGVRKEFPSVVVIAVEQQKVTFYDADDPDFPMWLVFDGGSRADMLYGLNDSPNNGSASMLNGKFCWTGNDVGQNGLMIVDFIKDDGWMVNDSVVGYYKYRGFIKDRNEGFNILVDSTFYQPIIDRVVYDVDMTVLPGARVDHETGLPIPTIVVATKDGTSVVKDNGRVVSRPMVWNGGAGGVFKVRFDGHGFWYGASYHNEFDGGYPGHAGIYSYSNIESTLNLSASNSRVDGELFIATGTDETNGPHTNTYWGANADVWLPHPNNANLGQFNIADGKYFSSNAGVLIVEDDGYLNAHITADYTTGYMPGRNNSCVLSTLNSTSTVTTDGSNKIVNGTFSSDTSSWYIDLAGGNGASIVASGGTLLFTQGSNSVWLKASQSFSTVIGKEYNVQFDITSNNNNANWQFHVGTSHAGAQNATFGYPNYPGYGESVFSFVASSTTTHFTIEQGGGANVTGAIDNVIIKEASPNNGFGPYGLSSIGNHIMTPVGNNSELTSFGFADNVHFVHPYTDDLNFGTGPFSITVWCKGPSVSNKTNTILDRAVSGSGGGRILMYQEYANSKPRLLINDASNSTYVTGQHSLDDNKWHCFHCNRRGDQTLEVWVDGVLQAKGGINPDGINVDATIQTRVGANWGGSDWFEGDLAMLRVSSHVPTPEQIIKIFNEEKVLFFGSGSYQEENACTLVGTDTIVNVLDFDKDTNLLHVGTDDGLSTFRGFRRINSTTDAVERSVRASSGLVVED